VIRCALICVCLLGASACGSEASAPSPKTKGEPSWQVVIEGAPGALLRAAGTSESGVFVVGADADGKGPLAYHLTEAGIERLETGEHGSLWWWHQTADDTLQMVGDGGLVLSYRLSTREFARIATPVTERIFGVWSARDDDIWYVGGDLDKGTGAVLRGDGSEITAPEVFANTPLTGAMFKVTGFGPDSVWMVGQRGRLITCDGVHYEQATLPTPLSLLSLSGVSQHDVFAVGGAANGVILHREGEAWEDETPAGLPPMNTVWAVDAEHAYAAGFNGHLYERRAGQWQEFSPIPPTFQDLHSVWVDLDGGIWLAGGRLTVDPPTDGVLLYYGTKTWKVAQP
jgi:hypothetical protein